MSRKTGAMGAVVGWLGTLTGNTVLTIDTAMAACPGHNRSAIGGALAVLARPDDDNPMVERVYGRSGVYRRINASRPGRAANPLNPPVPVSPAAPAPTSTPTPVRPPTAAPRPPAPGTVKWDLIRELPDGSALYVAPDSAIYKVVRIA